MLDWVHPSASEAFVDGCAQAISLSHLLGAVSRWIEVQIEPQETQSLSSELEMSGTESIRSDLQQTDIRHTLSCWTSNLKTMLANKFVSKRLTIFHFNFGFKTIVYFFSDRFFQKNLKLIELLIVCNNGLYLGKPDCLVSTTNLMCYRKPAKTVKNFDKKWPKPP